MEGCENMDKMDIIVNYLKNEIKELDATIRYHEENCIRVSKQHYETRKILVQVLMFVNSID